MLSTTERLLGDRCKRALWGTIDTAVSDIWRIPELSASCTEPPLLWHRGCSRPRSGCSATVASERSGGRSTPPCRTSGASPSSRRRVLSHPCCGTADALDHGAVARRPLQASALGDDRHRRVGHLAHPRALG